MNTYNENLQQTVVNTLSALSAQEASLDSDKTIAEFTLYHAQGAEITTREKLERTKADVNIWQDLNDQSLINDNQVFNLLFSATEANGDVTTSITNTATAASNVQIASNAISLLASDVGAALNIATASLYETDVYNRIVNANSFINEVANESKRIAKNAMNASSHTSEITTTEVLAQTQAVKSKIDNIFKAAQAELGNFTSLASAENLQLSQASQAERQAEGALKDADREVKAIIDAYNNANDQLNYGLSISVVSSSQIQVSFTALPIPLPTFHSTAASAISIPDANPNYYLALLPAQNQTTFSLDQAQQLFAQRSPDDTESFIYVDAQADFPVTLAQDVNGNPINPGSSYVAYLYVELSQAYKQFISNFSDLLSAPSQAFVPATTLPSPVGLTYLYPEPVDGLAWAAALFEVVGLYTESQTATTEATGNSTDASTAEDDAVVAATAAYQDAANAAAAADKAAAAADAVAIAADSDATQKAAAAAQAAAAETAAVAASAKASSAVTAAAAAVAKANAGVQANPNKTTQAAAAAANKKAAAANTAETAAIAAATTATANSVAAAKAATDAATAKATADAAKVAADAAKVAADAAAKEAAAQLAAAEAAAKTPAPVPSTAVINDVFANAQLEYRCILVKTSLDPYPNFLLCTDENNNPPVYFNLAIAEQVSPANYTAAIGPALKLLFAIKFVPGTTDNFGDVIEPGATYSPYILAVANGDDASQFVNVLAGPFDPFIVCHPQTQP